MFAERDYLESHPILKKELEYTYISQLSIVHPKKYLEVNEWLHSLHLAIQDILAVIPPCYSFILVDQGEFVTQIVAKGRIIPVLERNKQYWGLPPDDITAIRELERLRRAGANFIVFAWPAFWWLDYYSKFDLYLRSKFKCIFQNENIVIFDIKV